MQWKLTSFSALLALASAAQSFLLETPTQPVVTGEEIVLFYTANATDPIASILLVNHALPNETFVVVWDAPTWSGTVAGIPPCVPTNIKGWFLEAVNSTNYKQVLAASGTIDLVQGENCGGTQ